MSERGTRGSGMTWVGRAIRRLEDPALVTGRGRFTADLPATTQFPAPRFFMNNGATAAAVAYDCSGLYIETDY